MDEFDMIAACFRPLTKGQEEARGLLDDGAVLQIPDGQELVVSTDMLCEGVHFLADAAAGDIAHKALRSNLSDLAAMGARPYCYQLAIALPEDIDVAWLGDFTAALVKDQDEYGIFLSGGDTSRSKNGVSISITVMGLVPRGGAIGRSGAQNGDILLLTGPIGDSHIGLKVVQGEIETQDDVYFIEAHYRPQPRTILAEFLRECAHAAVDISDGLVADVGHICDVSGVGAVIEICGEMTSPHAQSVLENGGVSMADLITGGEDYELAIAIAPDDVDAFIDRAKALGVSAYVGGRFSVGGGVQVFDRKEEILEIGDGGYRHF